MSLRLGALYRNRPADEVRRSWQLRLAARRESRMEMDLREEGGLVRLELRPRRRLRIPHRVLGALVRNALGPEREEEAEIWLLETPETGPGALRLAGAPWDACLESVAGPASRQVRLWSPLVCPGGVRGALAVRGAALGLRFRVVESWTVLAVPRPKPEVEFPPPWRGNYGW